MRRIIIAATAVAALVFAAAAYAAITNTYTASFTWNQSGAGTAKKPVTLGFTENLGAANMTAGMPAEPLTDIKITASGIKTNYKYFTTTCSAAKIIAAKNDTVCPKGALIATGTVTATLYPQATPSEQTPCNPVLDVWNGGGGQLNFYFVISGGHECGGLQTGETNPYTATIANSGGGIVQNTPLPPDVSTEAGNLPGTYGALTNEVLKWSKLTVKVKGKTIPFLESTGCPGGSRSYTVAFTATDVAGDTATSSVAGKSKC